MTDKIKHRVIKEHRSSIIGIIIFAFDLLMLFLQKIEFTHFLTLLGVAFVCLGLKDKWLGFKGPAIVLLFFILCSCNAQKHWLSHGIKKGFVKKDSITSAFVIPVDTSKNDSLVNNAIDSIESRVTNMQEIDKDRPIIKAVLKKELIPVAVKMAYKDTVITKADGTIIKIKSTDKGLDAEIIYQKLEVKSIKEIPKWIWFIVIFQFVTILFLGFVIFKMFQVINAQRYNK
jgi:hypothetical protein